jgi:hypothetical protein
MLAAALHMQADDTGRAAPHERLARTPTTAGFADGIAASGVLAAVGGNMRA